MGFKFKQLKDRINLLQRFHVNCSPRAVAIQKQPPLIRNPVPHWIQKLCKKYRGGEIGKHSQEKAGRNEPYTTAVGNISIETMISQVGVLKPV